MPVSAARAAAFDMLMRVEREASYASELLHSPPHANLSAADHGLATELVMGVLRWRSRLDRQLAPASAQPLQKLDLEVLTALRLAAYQLAFLDRVPAHAALHESVELVKRARKRSAAPYVNAVLRKLSASAAKHDALPDSPPEKEPESAAALAERFAHPPWLVERWVDRYGVDAARLICEYNQQVPQTSIRRPMADHEAALAQAGIKLAPGRLLTSAARVVAGDLTATASFREGRVSIQDEASQLVAALVGEAASILDCCAAPGAKTRALAERNPGSFIVAADLHPHRARLLAKLLAERHVHVVAADAVHLPFTRQFERVLADVPCSGTGTLAHHPEIKWRLQPADLDDLQRRQLAILRSAMAQVAPGGRIVYSTCSLEPEENENVVQAALAEFEAFHAVPCRDELLKLTQRGELAWTNPASLTDGPYLRTLPGTHPCDGFFAAVLERS
jgi:16S rRNA (cytosine967-C5)-methyltransferase